MSRSPNAQPPNLTLSSISYSYCLAMRSESTLFARLLARHCPSEFGAGPSRYTPLVSLSAIAHTRPYPPEPTLLTTSPELLSTGYPLPHDFSKSQEEPSCCKPTVGLCFSRPNYTFEGSGLYEVADPFNASFLRLPLHSSTTNRA